MTENELKALKELAQATNNGFRIWNLSGNGNAKARVKIVSALKGRFVPQKEARISTLREIFRGLCPVGKNECEARWEKTFANWACDVLKIDRTIMDANETARYMLADLDCHIMPKLMPENWAKKLNVEEFWAYVKSTVEEYKAKSAQDILDNPR